MLNLIHQVVSIYTEKVKQLVDSLLLQMVAQLRMMCVFPHRCSHQRNVLKASDIRTPESQKDTHPYTHTGMERRCCNNLFMLQAQLKGHLPWTICAASRALA